jgi:hypothetical protein
MPASVSCSISSAETLPFCDICVSARVARWMPSDPVPIAPVASPSAVMIGMTRLTSTPIARNLLAESRSPGKSNGVLAANSLSSFR